MSSDSSDDEDLSKLREAADSQFINDSMFDHKKPKPQEGVQVGTFKSLRPTRNDDDEQFNLFRVTPEFRKHVAKHLSSQLDQLLQKTLVHKALESDLKRKRGKSRVKLFRDSTHFISMKPEPQVVRQRRVNNHNDTDDYDKCESVAVSPDAILSRKDTKHWSTRTKAPVFAYIQTNTGLVLK